jgi:hypothetical protein
LCLPCLLDWPLWAAADWTGQARPPPPLVIPTTPGAIVSARAHPRTYARTHARTKRRQPQALAAPRSPSEHTQQAQRFTAAPFCSLNKQQSSQRNSTQQQQQQQQLAPPQNNLPPHPGQPPCTAAATLYSLIPKRGIRLHRRTNLASTTQRSTTQRSTAQHSTAQHSTAQHSTATYPAINPCPFRSPLSRIRIPTLLPICRQLAPSSFFLSFGSAYCRQTSRLASPQTTTHHPCTHVVWRPRSRSGTAAERYCSISYLPSTHYRQSICFALLWATVFAHLLPLARSLET